AMWMPTAVGVLNLRKTQPDLDFGLGPMPRNKQFATQLQTNSLAIVSGAKERDIAWTAIAYMSREDQMQLWQADAALSAVPVRKALLDRAPWSDAASGWAPIIDVLKMPGGRPKPHIPDWAQVTEKHTGPSLVEAGRKRRPPRGALPESARRPSAGRAARPKASGPRGGGRGPMGAAPAVAGRPEGYPGPASPRARTMRRTCAEVRN